MIKPHFYKWGFYVYKLMYYEYKNKFILYNKVF